jgi:hypothetical protein
MYQINSKGDWIALKKRIMLSYPTITVEDLKLTDGDECDLLTRLQKKLSKTKSQIIKMIDKL